MSSFAANRGPKSKHRFDLAQIRDWHSTMGSLVLKAERATDSLERMLAVCRILVTFLSHILKPGTRWVETPTVIMGHHQLTHRELPEMHRGDPTRVYVQEICSYDPQEEPIVPKKYHAEGHTDVAKWLLQVVPVAHAKVRKEGLIAAGQPYLEVQFAGEAVVELYRHAERYTITLPSLTFANPLDEQCLLDYDGQATITCAATGLRTELRFRGWRDALVAGEVVRMAGDGTERVARIDGNWDGEILAYSTEADASGILFDDTNYPPQLPSPVTMNLAKPGPRLLSRFWSSIIEALLYADRDEASSVGKKALEMVTALESHLKGSLLYSPPDPSQLSKAKYDDEDAQLAAKDSRPLPPACRVERAKGRVLRYQVQHLVQSLSLGIDSSTEQQLLPALESAAAPMLSKRPPSTSSRSTVGASAGSTA